MRLTRASVPRLYAIADADALGPERLPEAIAAMARNGLRWVQLRAKHATDRELGVLVERTLAGLPEGVTLWINDRPDVAAAYGLEAVHLGQEDVSPGTARAVLGDSAWIGLSTHDLGQVAAADADPDVDLVAVGPIFPTRNKERPDPVVGLDTLRRARGATAKPLVAIGGIVATNLIEVLDAGADAVALLGAVASGDVAADCERLRAVAAERPPAPATVYLTGFMGAGKTSTGELLARRLGLPFVDLDREIEARSGSGIPELFRDRGEDAFRELEQEALEAASRGRAAVIATGGGAVVRPANRALMRRTGRLVWLDVPFDTMLARLRPDADRPLVRDPEQVLRLYRSRLDAYRSCDLRLEVEPSWSVEEVVARLGRLLRDET